MKAALVAIVLLCILLVPLRGKCESAVWGTIGFTKHAEPSRGCSVNPGVFRMWNSGNWRGYLGAHQKSDCDIGGVTGIAWLPLKHGKYSMGGTAMLLTDYRPPLFPAVAPAVSYDPTKRYGADFIFIPGVIAHFRWRWSFQ